MDPNRMTEKAQDAIRQAQNLAQSGRQSQIDAEHLAVALLVRGRRRGSRVVEKAGAEPRALVERLQQALATPAPRLRARSPAGPGLHLAARERVLMAAEARPRA